MESVTFPYLALSGQLTVLRIKNWEEFVLYIKNSHMHNQQAFYLGFQGTFQTEKVGNSTDQNEKSSTGSGSGEKQPLDYWSEIQMVDWGIFISALTSDSILTNVSGKPTQGW